MSTSGSRRKLAVFGLDGADLNLLRPWLEDGTLPCLSRLYREGSCGGLASTTPPLSPEAWASFATGNNPGKHGIVNFVQPMPGSYELQFSCGALRRGTPFWRLASDAGVTVGVVNVPMTYPPEEVNGFFVSGPDAPGVQAQFTWPAHLKGDLLTAAGPYEIHGDYWGRTTPQDYLRRLIGTVENHQNAWQYLLRRFEPDLFIGVFGSTDRAQHFLWKYADPTHVAGEAAEQFAEVNPLAAVYVAVDKAISDCLSLMGDDVIALVMSDHGAGPCSKVVYLDRWLERHGLLSYRESGLSWQRRLVERAYGLARRSLPRRVKDWMKTKWHGVRQEIESSIVRDPIDWSHTRAFFLGTESAYVYLNSQDRFPQGLVQPGPEAEKLCDRIIEGLSELVDPETGEAVVDRVYRREEIYHGQSEQMALLPDLVITWRNSEYVVRRAWGEPAASPGVIVESGIKVGEAARLMSLELSACHRPEGMLLATGPGIPAGAEISGAGIMDLAPTALSLLGVPVPSDMDGRPIADLLPATSPGTVAKGTRGQSSAGRTAGSPDTPYSDAEREEMARRLRGLGYLD